jgi:predicted nucleic acid-binding protein
LPDSLLYLDASALVKLLVAEPESEALSAFVGEWRYRITSRITTVEVTRAVRREPIPEIIARAEAVLDAVAFVELTPDVAELAGRLDPPVLRSLDAVHVASALSIGADAGPFVTYDVRLGDAATRAGLEVQAPA